MNVANPQIPLKKKKKPLVFGVITINFIINKPYNEIIIPKKTKNVYGIKYIVSISKQNLMQLINA